jgi:hypothetical protein
MYPLSPTAIILFASIRLASVRSVPVYSKKVESHCANTWVCNRAKVNNSRAVFFIFLIQKLRLAGRMYEPGPHSSPAICVIFFKHSIKPRPFRCFL